MEGISIRKREKSSRKARIIPEEKKKFPSGALRLEDLHLR